MDTKNNEHSICTVLVHRETQKALQPKLKETSCLIEMLRSESKLHDGKYGRKDYHLTYIAWRPLAFHISVIVSSEK